MKTSLIALAIIVLQCLTAGLTHALTVSGQVTDATTVPIVGIRVEVYDEDVLFDDLLEVVYTNAAGNYSSGAASSGDDIYVIAKWEFQLVPAAFYNNRVVRILDIGAGQNPYVPATIFTEKREPKTGSISNITAIE